MQAISLFAPQRTFSAPSCHHRPSKWPGGGTVCCLPELCKCSARAAVTWQGRAGNVRNGRPARALRERARVRCPGWARTAPLEAKRSAPPGARRHSPRPPKSFACKFARGFSTMAHKQKAASKLTTTKDTKLNAKLLPLQSMGRSRWQ